MTYGDREGCKPRLLIYLKAIKLCLMQEKKKKKKAKEMEMYILYI